MNNASITGRFAHDLELRHLTNDEQTAVIETQLAVNRPRSRKATFLNVVIFGKTAEAVAQYCERGDMVAITGYIENSEWRDQDTDEPRSRQRIVAREVDFLLTKRRRDGEPEVAPVEPEAVPF